MLKFDFNDDSSNTFEMAWSHQQPDPLEETPTCSEPGVHEEKEDQRMNTRIIQEDLTHKAKADDLGIWSAAEDIATVKSQPKRKNNGSVSPAMKNSRALKGGSVSTLSNDEALKEVVDLVKKLGTDKVRELCDLIDCVAQ